MRLLTTCLLCVLAMPAVAQIYKYTDERGNTVFTNQPPEGQKTETIVLPPTNTTEAVKPSASTTTPGTPQATEAAPYQTLEIVNMPTEEALRANNGTFTVEVRVRPSLRPQHMLRLLLDGKPYGPPAKSARMVITSADRGEHSLAVEVVDGNQRVQQSPTVTFTVQRVNTSSPAFPRRAAP